MKKVKSLLIFAMMVIGFSTFAQSPKLIAVVNHANWCPSCQSNGDRVSKEVISKLDSKTVQVMVNDMTDDASKAKAEAELSKAGVLSAVQTEKGSGVILLIDAKTKKIVAKIPVSNSSEEINNAISVALKG